MARASIRKLPWGLIGMLALVVLIEGRLARLTLEVTSDIAWDWDETGRHGPIAAQGSEVAFLGNSMAKFGLLPSEVQARSGRQTYNLSLLSGSEPAGYVMLRRLLDRGITPRSLVVSFDQERLSLQLESENCPYPWGMFLRPREALEVAWTARDPHFLARYLVDWTLASSRLRVDLRAAIVKALDGQFRSRFANLMSMKRNKWTNRGTILIAPVDQAREDPVQAVVPDEYDVWKLESVNQRYLKKFLELTLAHRIDVYWLLPPRLAGWQSNRDRSRAEERYLAMLRHLAERTPNLTIVDGRHAGYPMEAFHDQAHVNEVGAVALSAAVAEVLQQGPSGARWRDLPRYQPTAASSDLEDVRQSTLALEAGEKLRLR